MVAAPSRLPERAGATADQAAGSGSAGVGAGRGAWGSPGHGCVGGVGCGSAGSRGNGWVGGPVFRFVMGCPVSDQGAGGRAVRAGRWSRRHPSRPGGRCWTSPSTSVFPLGFTRLRWQGGQTRLRHMTCDRTGLPHVNPGSRAAAVRSPSRRAPAPVGPCHARSRRFQPDPHQCGRPASAGHRRRRDGLSS